MRKHTARGTENGKNLIQGLNAFFQRPSLVFFVFRLSGLCSALRASHQKVVGRTGAIQYLPTFLYFTPAPAALLYKVENQRLPSQPRPR